MSLYQKYRPQSLDDIIGNEKEIKALKKSIDKEDHSHVYLLTGDRGSGKTTIARILARHFGADESTIREMNSSDDRGIDAIRGIIDSCSYTYGSSLVYILDECHNLSKDSMNALLKILEDTPSHVYFFLCTTDPQKLIAPLVSRCTPIKLSSLNIDDMSCLLKGVAKQEWVKFSHNVYEAIHEASQGSPRQALVLLEKIIGLDDEQEILDIIQNTGDSDTKEVIDLCRLLVDTRTKWADIKEVVKKIESPDWESIRYAVLGYSASVLLNSGSHKAALVIESFRESFYNSGKAGFLLACHKSIGG